MSPWIIFWYVSIVPKYEQLNFAAFSNGFINCVKRVILSLILVTTYAHYLNFSKHVGRSLWGGLFHSTLHPNPLKNNFNVLFLSKHKMSTECFRALREYMRSPWILQRCAGSLWTPYFVNFNWLVKTVISLLPDKRRKICKVIARRGFQWSSNLNIAEDILDPACLITVNADNTVADFPRGGYTIRPGEPIVAHR
jgi:hypothetical protein